VNGVLWLGCGALIALGFAALTRSLSRHHESMLYALGLILAALIYLGHSLSRGVGWRAIGIEGAATLFFTGLGLAGWRRSAFMLALGWALHGGWDLWAHANLAGNLMPYWYRWSCAGFDLVVAGYVMGRFAKS